MLLGLLTTAALASTPVERWEVGAGLDLYPEPIGFFPYSGQVIGRRRQGWWSAEVGLGRAHPLTVMGSLHPWPTAGIGGAPVLYAGLNTRKHTEPCTIDLPVYDPPLSGCVQSHVDVMPIIGLGIELDVGLLVGRLRVADSLEPVYPRETSPWPYTVPLFSRDTQLSVDLLFPLGRKRS